MVADTTVSGSFHERFEARYDELAPAERRVAEELLNLGPPALVLSAVALGERLGTSDATVIRTAKALGYPTLADLRLDLAASTAGQTPDARLRRTLSHTDRPGLLASFVDDQIAALEGLTRKVDAPAFDLATDLLAEADRVVWRGVGPSAQLAQYGELLAARIGKPSASFVHTGTSFADELMTLTARDATVLLAYGPMQAHVDVMIERATEIGSPVVLITDTLGRKLAKRVRVTLQSGRGTPGEFASHTATLVIIEALTLAIASRDTATAEAALGTLNDLRAAVAGRRLDVDAATTGTARRS